MTIQLTVKEAAKRLRVSTDTIYRKIESGELKASRPFEEYRIPITEIERLLTPDEGPHEQDVRDDGVVT